MALMIGASDNCAAMTCIQDIGFQYINGLLVKAGFFKNNVGLWLGAPYSTPCNGTTIRWAQVPGGKFPNDTGYQIASPKTLAKFMGLIDERNLVSGGDSVTMLNLMNKRAPPGETTRSFFYESLERMSLVHLSGFSKLGMGSMNSDAAIIQRTLPSRTDIRYVAVGLGESGNLGGRLLNQLGVELDTCIAGRHAP
jgi:hypothetical protein